jgi:predicted nucleic acid-binding protein
MKVNTKQFIHKKIVIDTSALIKPYLAEENSLFIRDLTQLHLQKQLSIFSTPLITFELLNVLSIELRDPEKVKTLFNKYLELKIPLIYPDYTTASHAIPYSCSNKKISFYDSSYHALAKQLDGILITADKKYYEKMKDEGNIFLLN